MKKNRIEITLDNDQIEAFEILKKYSYNRAKLIKLAIHKYLYSDEGLSQLINEARRQKYNESLPDFMK